MRVTASIGAGIEGRSKRSANAINAAEADSLPNLPMVIAQARPAKEQSRRILPLASILAQLAAHAGDHPTTRARRRADPMEGANLYGMAASVSAPAKKNTIKIV